MTEKFRIGFLLFPNITQLDFTGPAQFFAKLSQTEIYYIVKENKDVPVTTDSGFRVLGNVSIADCPKLDMICIPGGAGTHDVMEDKYILDWLKAIAPEVSYITSVCTGSLVLAAAGLLVGYQATCHWAYRDTLSLFGAIPTNERVVIDRNRITGGGVTAGIDFALTIIRQLRGEREAELVQLHLEYNPQPVISGGSPEKVSSETLQEMMTVLEQKGLNQRLDRVRKVAEEFNQSK